MNLRYLNRTLKYNISKLNSYLFILLGFTMPLSISIATIVIGIIILLWFYEGRFNEKYEIIKQNPINYAFVAFFLVQIVGLLWTHDMKWGLHIVGKEWRMLLPLIFMTIVRKEHIKYYIFSFILAMSITELLSYLIFFKIIPPFLNASVYDPIPFITHLFYNPYLAFSIFILIYLTIFQKTNINLLEKIISAVFIFTMSANMFITGGRAGQVGFFVMLSLAVFLYFKKNIFKAILVIVILIPIIFGIAYKTSNIFSNRVDMAVTNAKNFKNNPNTSVGLRLTFLMNSIDIIKDNPIFGVGTGDFPEEYKKVSEKNTPSASLIPQPHNMYLLQLTQTGILGLISLLSIFYIEIRIALKTHELSQLRLALPVLVLVIMLSDSYLLGHYVSLLFVYFSSFLYKDFEKEKEKQ